jgi:hypothetical protein
MSANEIDRASRQRKRIADWLPGAKVAEVEATAMDRNVNRASEQVKEDGLTRYVFYAPDGSGLIYRSRVPPPPEVRVYVVVDNKDYPRRVER